MTNTTPTAPQDALIADLREAAGSDLRHKAILLHGRLVTIDGLLIDAANALLAGRQADDELREIGRLEKAALTPPITQAASVEKASGHLIDGEFQSDKYPTTPRGKVPLSVKDKTAQDLLYVYAQRRRTVDAEFAADLETALLQAGYEPPNLKSADDLAEFIARSHGFVKPAEISAEKAGESAGMEAKPFNNQTVHQIIAVLHHQIEELEALLRTAGDGWNRDMSKAPRDGTPVDLWGDMPTDSELRPAAQFLRRFPNCSHSTVPGVNDNWPFWHTETGCEVSAKAWMIVAPPTPEAGHEREV